MEIPSITSYGDYTSDNYGRHTLHVSFDRFSLYYSYDTIVAYFDRQDGLVCRQNDWNTTTGKHLNWIEPNHKARIPGDIFETKLQAMLARHIQ